MIEYLIAIGADPFNTNQCNINMLHVAAQGDQPISLAYFMALGLDINSRDTRNSTPLHWAAFAGADMGLSFIVARNADVNSRDIKGLTPLHLAVKTSEDIKTTRSIRALLLKGADPTIKDHNNNMPKDFLKDFDQEQPLMVDFAKEIEEILLTDDINSLLYKLNPCKDYECMSWKTKFKKRTKSSKTMQLFFLLMCSTYFVQQFYVYPIAYPKFCQIFAVEGGHDIEDSQAPKIAITAHNVLFIICLIVNVVLAFKNPGYLSKAKATGEITIIPAVKLNDETLQVQSFSESE